jgi:hypothetical protein
MQSTIAPPGARLPHRHGERPDNGIDQIFSNSVDSGPLKAFRQLPKWLAPARSGVYRGWLFRFGMTRIRFADHRFSLRTLVRLV